MVEKNSRWALPDAISRPVKIWLLLGLFMVLMQIVIGGVTRLTGSGLSITKWEIVTGAIPPLNETQWQAEFELYRQTPQYQKINQGMSLEAFKFIYFWEYFHRLWARMMFFVFIFPFAWFLWKGMLSKELRNWLIAVVLLAGLEGFFGWIMVASGLRQRPWVNAYNLTLHLCMGVIIFSTLLWTAFIAFRPNPRRLEISGGKRTAWIIFSIAFFQLALGAMMSGTKAGLFYPTWPDQGGTFLPGVLLDPGHWTLAGFMEYDTNPFMPALIQFLHRNTAYLLTVIILWVFWKARSGNRFQENKNLWYLLLFVLSLQVTLGILTLINCIGVVPVDLGVYHQSGAVLLLSILLWMCFKSSERSKGL
ncbi:MAG: COX15/CtaA family protein [Saprospiraceae bacterium]|nr:COX15/CtaA family protein [Saprospiraceae bacterium]